MAEGRGDPHPQNGKVFAERNNRTPQMYAVNIHVRPGELSGRMSEMRLWLDKHPFEPSAFSCHNKSFETHVSVKFRVAQEAEAFAQCFRGRTDRSSGAVNPVGRGQLQ
jgi:hypothetical protein